MTAETAPPQVQAAAPAKMGSWVRRNIVLLGLLAITLLLFGDLLTGWNPAIISAPEGDINGQFLGWRTWAFQQWRQGSFPAWNPHVYAGAPFFSGMQSALFYPPNWIYLWVMPTWGINFEVAFHVLLLGLTAAAWARGHGISRGGALATGCIATLGGPHYLHVYAGHLPNLAAMAWVPALWWGVDRTLEANSRHARLRALWLMAFFVAMLVLAGHGQYLFYSVLATLLYTFIRLPRTLTATGEPGRSAINGGVLLAAATLGVALAALQLLPTLAIGKETVRSGGLPWETASMFSLPPAQLLSAALPRFFGPTPELPFWAPWYFWEMSLYVGGIAMVLALMGLRRENGQLRRGPLLLGALFLILAFGAYTPLYRALYEWFPAYSSFRGTSKWGFYALLCLALQAGHGVDHWRSDAGQRSARLLQVAGPAIAAMLGLLALGLRTGVLAGPWQTLVHSVGLQGGSYLNPATYQHAGFLAASAQNAAHSLLWAALILFLAAGAAWLRLRQSRYAELLPLLAVAELLAFAWVFRATFTPPWQQLAQWQSFNAALPAGERVVQPGAVNQGLLTGTLNLLGNDPFVLKRYARLIAATQGQDPATASQYLDIRQFSPALRLLRCYGAVVAGPDGLPQLAPAPQPPLPQAFLCRRWRVEPDAEKILKEVTQPHFDPRQTVWLESPPTPAIAAAPQRKKAQGKAVIPDEVRVVASTSGALTLEVRTESPAVLVITDLWAQGWQASGSMVELGANGGTVPAAMQGTEYHLQPANYAVRGLALQAGQHRIQLRYVPPGIKVGAALSAVAGLLWLAVGMALWRGRRPSEPDSGSREPGGPDV